MQVLLYLLLLIPVSLSQFTLFGTPEPQVEHDQLGVKDAFSIWGRILRNMANQNRDKTLDQLARETAVRPNKVDEDELKKLAKNNKEIINERLLNILLPRIKGETPFTTTGEPTTVTTTVKPKPTKVTKKPAPKKTTTKKPSTTKTNKTTKKPVQHKEKATTKKIVEEADESSENKTETMNPKFSVHIHTETTPNPLTVEDEVLAILQKKINDETEKMQKKPESEFNLDKINEAEKSYWDKLKEIVEKFEKTHPKKESQTETVSVKNIEKPAEEKKESEQKPEKEENSKKVEKDIEEKTSEKVEKDKEEKEKKETEKSEVKTEKEEISHQEDSEKKTTSGLVKMSKELTEEINLRNMLKEKEVEIEELVRKALDENKVTIDESATIESSGTDEEVEVTSPSTTTEKPSTTTSQTTTTKKTTTTEATTTVNTEEAIALLEAIEEVAADKEIMKSINNSTTFQAKSEEEMTEEEMENKVENETAEILELLKQAEKKKKTKSSESRKLLMARLKEFLDNENEGSTESSTESTTKKFRNPESSTVTKKITTLKLETSTASLEVGTRKIENIPEAEEEGSEEEDVGDVTQNGSFLQIASDDVAPSTTTTTTTAAPTSTSPGINGNAAAGGTVYNLQANANSDASPKLTNVITPIAGILDGISPILLPLLASGGAAARARAAGLRTYQPIKQRGLMDDTMSENSLVGFGSQLAREILQPGSLKKEKELREQALAAKIADAKERNGGSSNSLISQLIQMAQTGAPLIVTTPPSILSQNIPVSTPQIIHAAPSLDQSQAFIQTPNNMMITVPPPPPGYNGPLPPPPPPPPMGYVPAGYQGPIPSTFVPQTSFVQQALDNQVVDGASSPSANTPYFPPEITSHQSSFSLDDSTPNVPNIRRAPAAATVDEDSGLRLGTAPASDPSAPSDGNNASGGGFGGGRKPSSIPFEESEPQNRPSGDILSFFNQPR